MSTEVKMELKKPLINFDKKSVKNLDDVTKIRQENPTLTQKQIIDKCPSMTFGETLPSLLLRVATDEPTEKLKLFRWASKIQDKMITDKGELTLDANQITELTDFIGKIPNTTTVVIAPILIYLEELKEQLK